MKLLISSKLEEGVVRAIMQARYQMPEIGRFVSRDPASDLLGDQSFERVYNTELDTYLSNPQNLNTYSYAQNNPIKYIDPNGEMTLLAVLARILLIYTWVEVGFILNDLKTVLLDYSDEFEGADTAESIRNALYFLQIELSEKLLFNNVKAEVAVGIFQLIVDFVEQQVDNLEQKEQIEVTPPANQGNAGGGSSGNHNRSSNSSQTSSKKDDKPSTSSNSSNSSSRGSQVSSNNNTSPQIQLTESERNALARAAVRAYYASGGQ